MDVQEAWTRLRAVRELIFEATSRAATDTGWNGSGKGAVEIQADGAGTIVFHERGAWTPEGGRQRAFSNVFRWTVDPDGHFIRLEHLRFGPDRPVHLFNLVPVDEDVFESSEPHICREDSYAARMEIDRQTVRLQWTVKGPKKAESISYTYL